jgi:hypothetical protein
MNLVDLALWWSLLYLGIAMFQSSKAAIAIGLILLVLATALSSTALVNIAFVRNERLWRFIWVILIQELSRLPLVPYSCLTDEIVWRGRRFRVDSDGTTRIVDIRAAAQDSGN